jgi:DNA-binding FadR family transcriptional regulator
VKTSEGDRVTAGYDLTAVLRPVRAGNAFEETVERLLTAIKLGFVKPGERFPAERELAAQLGVSRITLREAIRALQQAGYVQSRRGRFGGTFVTGQPPRQGVGELRRLAREEGEQLTDALTFRMAVETGAARVLAAHVRDGDHCTGNRIADMLRSRLADLAASRPADYRRLDTLFHLAIADLTGSQLLSVASTDARMRLNDLLNAIPVLWRNIENTAPQHAAIADAILAGDPQAAATAVTQHLEGTEALLRGFLA